MKKCNVTKILIIISIIIICLGVISGLIASNEFQNGIPTEEVYVDGSNFSGLVEFGEVIGSKMLGTAIVFFSIFVDILIWFIYGIILVIIEIINKIKHKKVV